MYCNVDFHRNLTVKFTGNLSAEFTENFYQSIFKPYVVLNVNK